MTEQEKREKGIEEMTKVASPNCLAHCKNCGWSKACTANIVSIKLYDAGYRKSDEVEKQTAKRFLKMLYDMGVDRQTVETCGLYDVNGSALARFVSQEFGVEVEE